MGGSTVSAAVLMNKTPSRTFAEMQICSEFLHCSLDEFRRLSRRERVLWYAYRSAKIEIEVLAAKKARTQSAGKFRSSRPARR